MILIKTHIDGIWNTTYYSYMDRSIIIKSGKGKGIKVHIFYPNSSDKVQKTLRYNFIRPDLLLIKAKLEINKLNLVTI